VAPLAGRLARIMKWLAAAMAGPAVAAGTLAAASAVTPLGWDAYLAGPAHASYNAADTAIQPGNAGALVRKWQRSGNFYGSPTVAGGFVFIGSYTGWFYKLSETTGAVLGKAYLGFQKKKTCSAFGIADTATAALDPVTHRETVYVGGPDGYLYAFSAATMKLKWKSVIAVPSSTTSDYFDWSSPTVANGKVYIGVASNCENPLVRGGVIGYHQSTGKRFAEFHSVPAGSLGGGVWSSVAVDSAGDVYATVGEGKSGTQGYNDSIVKLNGATLAPLGSFRASGEFGGSPTIFGSYVGACAKNGIYYVLRRSTMHQVWQEQIGTPYAEAPAAECDAAAVYDGTHLFLAGTGTTIGDQSYRGSVQERNPATGALVWETGLPEGVTGSPSLNGGRVLAVGTWDNGSANAVFLVNATTGAIVRTLNRGDRDFAQNTFADGWLFTANGSAVSAWGPR